MPNAGKSDKNSYIIILLQTLVVFIATSNVIDVQSTQMEKSETAKTVIRTKTTTNPERSIFSDYFFKQMKVSDFSAKELNRMTSLYNKYRTPARSKNETNKDRTPPNFPLNRNNYNYDRNRTKKVKRTEFKPGRIGNDAIPRHGNISEIMTPRDIIFAEGIQRNLEHFSIIRPINGPDVDSKRTNKWPEKELFEYSDRNFKTPTPRNITKIDNYKSKPLKQENNAQNDTHLQIMNAKKQLTLLQRGLLQRNHIKNNLTR